MSEIRIEILGAELVGPRGLSGVVKVEDCSIVIDPGLELGYRRHGLLPLSTIPETLGA